MEEKAACWEQAVSPRVGKMLSFSEGRASRCPLCIGRMAPGASDAGLGAEAKADIYKMFPFLFRVSANGIFLKA